MGYPIQQSQTAQALVFLMVDSTDHLAGKTGLTVTVTLSKNGAAFASPSGAVSEVGSGWYKVAGNATDSGTLGPLALHATATGADPTDESYHVVSYNPQDAVRLGLTALPNAAAEAAGGLYTRGTGAGQINQPANGQVDANAVKVSGTAQTARDLGASVLISPGTGAGQLDVTGGVIKSNLVQILATALTETVGGYLTAAFKKLFDVATPALTAASVNQTGDSYVRLGAAGAGLTALGDTRIGNLDAAVSSRSTDALVWAYATRTLTSGGGETQLATGTAQAGAASTITLAAGASATNSLYNNCIIALTGGTGAGQSAIITGYVGSTKVATINGTWATNPGASTTYVILPLGSIPGASAPTASQNAAAVWDEARASHTAAGSFGQGVASVQGNVTGSAASVAGAVGSVTATVNAAVQSVASSAIADAGLAADLDIYQARVWVIDDNTGSADRYTVVFHKNGMPVVAGVTSPTIQVIKAADATDLIASIALTQIASTGLYKFDATTTSRMADGAAYIAKVTATLDGSTRTMYQQVGRDS